MCMTIRVIACCAALLLAACPTADPLYCDEDTPCTDPALPFCDLDGDFEESGFHGRTCITCPADTDCSDGGVADARIADASSDAGECEETLLFERSDVGGAEIYAMRPDGTDLVNLTNSPGDDEDPRWSPDGQRIAFVSMRDGNAEIYVASSDGTGATNITNNSAEDLQPRWSPDGQRIAFVSDRGGDRDVFVCSSDGSNVVDVSRSAGTDWFPSWKPDGERIVFYSDRDANNEVYLANSRTGWALLRT